MGANSSSNNQATYVKQSNTLQINSSTDFLNQTVLNSIQKSITNSQSNCSQSFKSSDVLQISNISSLGDINISNLSIDAKSVVVLDCISETQILNQTENNFLSDNQAGIASVLQSVGNSDFLNNVSGSLKSTIDSFPGLNNTTSNNNQQVSIDNDTATNLSQSIKNIYQSTATKETDVQNISSIVQEFKSENKLIVNNLSSGGNVNISVLKINSITNFSSTAKLAVAISNVILEKMQNILGMKVAFQSSNQSTNTSSSTQSVTTTSTTSGASFFKSVDNAIGAVSQLLGTPKTMVIVFGIGAIIVLTGLIIGIVMLFRSLFASPEALNAISNIAQKGLDKIPAKGFGMSLEDVQKFDEIIKNSFNVIQEDTINLLKDSLY